MFRLRKQHIHQLFLLEESELFKVLDSRMKTNHLFNYCFAHHFGYNTIQYNTIQYNTIQYNTELKIKVFLANVTAVVSLDLH